MFETFEGLPHNLTYREMHLFAIFNHRRYIWEHNRWCCVFLCIWQYFSITCTCRSQRQLDFFLVHISLAEMRKKPYVTHFFISTCTDSGLSQCVLYFDLMWLSKTVTDIDSHKIYPSELLHGWMLYATREWHIWMSNLWRWKLHILCVVLLGSSLVRGLLPVEVSEQPLRWTKNVFLAGKRFEVHRELLPVSGL